MKFNSIIVMSKGSFGPLVIAVAFIVLAIASSCTRYNPRTGMYEPDPGMTMVAVGSAALAGSVIYNEAKRDSYRRPPYHYHYYRPAPPPGRPGPPPPRRR